MQFNNNNGCNFNLGHRNKVSIENMDSNENCNIQVESINNDIMVYSVNYNNDCNFWLNENMIKNSFQNINRDANGNIIDSNNYYGNSNDSSDDDNRDDDYYSRLYYNLSKKLQNTKNFNVIMKKIDEYKLKEEKENYDPNTITIKQMDEIYRIIVNSKEKEIINLADRLGK